MPPLYLPAVGPSPDPTPPPPSGLHEARGDFAPAPLSLRQRSAIAPRTNPFSLPPDPALVLALGLTDCLDLGVIPLRRHGAETLVLAQSPLHFAAARTRLTGLFGPFLRPRTATRAEIEATLLRHFAPDLAAAAETRVPPHESCRSLDALRLRRIAAIATALAAVVLVTAPLALFAFAFLLATLSLATNTAFKCAAALAALRIDPNLRPTPLDQADLPAITLLIALYREADIAPRLIARIGALDYPRDRLECLLIVEDDDTATRTALAASTLPPWMRVVAAPAGTIRTKPRALNFALDLAQGDIIGVYDAEDSPTPDQLQTVAATFASGCPRTACVQGVLDFYNPRKNWLARCFTLEYALWFRLVLPGIEHLGLPLPLGGTSVFLRRDVLRALGGWDAHNVTEDADLGIRLARHGYATRMIPSTTYEEANCRPLPWVRQRSRWIKGYLMTWLVHMRNPRHLWRDLGPRGFAGFQIVFAGSLMQVLLVPVLWSLWAIPLGLGHPLTALLPPAALGALGLTFLLAEATGTALTLIALRRSGQRINWLWIPTLHAYFPLGTLAALKALAETLWSPFYWDKTRHGQFHDTP